MKYTYTVMNPRGNLIDGEIDAESPECAEAELRKQSFRPIIIKKKVDLPVVAPARPQKKYTYTVINPKGILIDGEIDAESPESADAKLRKQSFRPIIIENKKDLTVVSAPLPKKLTVRERLLRIFVVTKLQKVEIDTLIKEIEEAKLKSAAERELYKLRVGRQYRQIAVAIFDSICSSSGKVGSVSAKDVRGLLDIAFDLSSDSLDGLDVQYKNAETIVIKAIASRSVPEWSKIQIEVGAKYPINEMIKDIYSLVGRDPGRELKRFALLGDNKSNMRLLVSEFCQNTDYQRACNIAWLFRDTVEMSCFSDDSRLYLLALLARMPGFEIAFDREIDRIIKSCISNNEALKKFYETEIWKPTAHRKDFGSVPLYHQMPKSPK